MRSPSPLAGIRARKIDPGTVVTAEIDHGRKTVDGQEVKIVELCWNRTERRSFDVYRVSDGLLLTEEESFDQMPSSEQIRRLQE